MIGKRLESDLSVQTLYYCPDGFCTDACSIVLSGQVFPIDCMDFVGKSIFHTQVKFLMFICGLQMYGRSRRIRRETGFICIFHQIAE